MGYFGKLEEKHLAQTLRRSGWSYGQILKRVAVSKDTISSWCRDIPLTESQKKRLLLNKSLGQRKGSLVAADNKRRARIERTKKIKEEAIKELGQLSLRDKFIAGVAFYAAEGDKADYRGGFANADPRFIGFMTDWFTKIAGIREDKLRGAIWLHEGLSERRAKIFWSKLSRIPLNHFRKTYIAKVKSNSKKIRKNIHSYGVFSLEFSDVVAQRRILGWISALLGDKMQSIPV